MFRTGLSTRKFLLLPALFLFTLSLGTALAPLPADAANPAPQIALPSGNVTAIETDGHIKVAIVHKKEARQKFKKGVNKATGAVKKTAKKTGKGLKKAGEKTGKGLKKAGKAVGKAAKKTRDKAKGMAKCKDLKGKQKVDCMRGAKPRKLGKKIKKGIKKLKK